MPFVSKAQQRWAHTKSGREALGGPAKVAEWDQATTNYQKLPERKHPKAPSSTPLADHFQRLISEPKR